MRSNNRDNYPLTACIHWGFKLSVRSILGYCDAINRRSLATWCACIQSREGMHWRERQNQMAPGIVSKRGFGAFVLWVLKGRNMYRVIIRIETGHSNPVSCFGPRIRALARYFTSATPRWNALASALILGPEHDTSLRFEWPVLILQTTTGQHLQHWIKSGTWSSSGPVQSSPIYTRRPTKFFGWMLNKTVHVWLSEKLPLHRQLDTSCPARISPKHKKFTHYRPKVWNIRKTQWKLSHLTS